VAHDLILSPQEVRVSRLVVFGLCASLLVGCITPEQKRAGGWALIGGGVASGLTLGALVALKVEDGRTPALFGVAVLTVAMIAGGIALIWKSFSKPNDQQWSPRRRLKAPAAAPAAPTNTGYYLPEAQCVGHRCKRCPSYRYEQDCVRGHGPCRRIRGQRVPCPSKQMAPTQPTTTPPSRPATTRM
jgi:hypothetical protein